MGRLHFVLGEAAEGQDLHATAIVIPCAYTVFLPGLASAPLRHPRHPT